MERGEKVHPYLLPFPWLLPSIRKQKIHRDPEKEAKKRLKRDFDFSFNKDKRVYQYKGQEISEKAAIEVVKEYGVAELKERLKEECPLCGASVDVTGLCEDCMIEETQRAMDEGIIK